MAGETNTPAPLTPVFIGGTGRSGTRVLKDALDANPAVRSTGHEIRLLTDPGGAIELVSALSDGWSPYTADIALHRFRDLCAQLGRPPVAIRWPLNRFRDRMSERGIRPWRYHHLDLDFLGGKSTLLAAVDAMIDDLVYARSEGTWAGSPTWRLNTVIFETHPRSRVQAVRCVADLLNTLITDHAAPEHTHWCDDTPYNVLHAHELSEIFPESRMIHIFRDPRDVVCSYVQQHWSDNDASVAAQRVVDVHLRWQEIRRKLDPDCYREARMEDLVADPPAVLARLGAWLGLDYESVDSRVVTPARAHEARWRRELRGAEGKRALEILDPLVESLGYASADN